MVVVVGLPPAPSLNRGGTVEEGGRGEAACR